MGKLRAELNTFKVKKDPDLMAVKTTSLDSLNAKLSSLKQQEETLLSKSIILGKAIEDVGNTSGPSNLSNDLKDIGSKVDQSSVKITKGFHKGLRSLKMFSIALIGTREIWSLLTQSANTYISSNEKLQAKLEGTKQALGQALAPVIEISINAFAKLVQWLIVAINYLFTFINVIFGTKLAILQQAKALDKVGSSAKSANKQLSTLAGFDELNILSQNSGSSGAVTPDMSGFGMSDEQMGKLNEFSTWLKDNQATVQAFAIVLGILAGAFIILNSPLLLTVALIALLVYTIVEVVKIWGTLSDAQKAIIIGLGVILAIIIALVIIQNIWNISLLACPATWIILAIIAVIALLIASFFLIRDNWDKIVAFFVNTFKKIGEFFSNLGKSIGDFFKGIWEGIVNGVKGAINWVSNFISSIGDVFKKVWNGILNLLGKGGQIFLGVVDGIANIMKGVINAIIGGLNFIIRKPLEFINGVLNFIRNIEFLGISPFKGLWKNNPVPIPQIPKLASGSSLTEETLFVGGEYPGARANPELVSPKNDVKDALKEAVSELGGMANSGPRTITIINELGGKEVGRKIINLINDTQEDAGKTLLKV